MKREKKYGKPPCRLKIKITGEEFLILVKKFEYRGDWSEVFYLYFDTDDCQNKADLYSQQFRLRVRERKGEYSLELKKYKGEKHVEMSQWISDEEFRLLFQGLVPNGEIRRNISFLQKPVRCIGLANTVRKKIHFHHGILVLDQTHCNAHTYYGIEFRSDEAVSPEIIQEIQSQLNVPMREYQLKIEELWGT